MADGRSRVTGEMRVILNMRLRGLAKRRKPSRPPR
jgi:hypothetical protein